MQLGDTLETKIEMDGDYFTVRDAREPGETDAQFINRHFDHIKAFIRENS